MSTKNNALIGAAASALGMTVTAGAKPVCDGLLNDYNVTGFGAAEVDAAGRVLVLVSVLVGSVTSVRPVADANGNVRLYVDGNAAIALAKRANLGSGVQVKFVKMDKATSVGDPIVALKSRYKRFKTEGLNSAKQLLALTAKQSAAVALGWDTATGTPEFAEFTDIAARGVSLGEWNDFNAAQVTSLAASLTAAGIDPVTVV